MSLSIWIKTIGCTFSGELSTMKHENRCVSAIFIIRHIKAAVLGLYVRKALSEAFILGEMEKLAVQTRINIMSIFKQGHSWASFRVLLLSGINSVSLVSEFCVGTYANAR